MDERWTILGPETKLSDLVHVVAIQLLENNLNAFDFHIEGTAPNGSSILLHFECSIEMLRNVQNEMPQ